jgi:pyrroline-5-carboxylate reductase
MASSFVALILFFAAYSVALKVSAVRIGTGSPHIEMTTCTNMSSKVIGFLGCGKISSALVRGYATTSGAERPHRIIISPRNREKSQKLKEDFPDLVEVAKSNEDVVSSADIVFIGLLPGTAREILPQMPFTNNQQVISMMAAVDYVELLDLLKLDGSKVVRTVPLPSSAKRTGPILVHPTNPDINSILSLVGKPVVCNEESEMKPLVSLTGHISPFYEIMRETQDWAVANGQCARTITIHKH